MLPFAFVSSGICHAQSPASRTKDTIYFAVYKGADRAKMESIIKMVSEELFDIPIKMLEIEIEVPEAAYVDVRKKYYAGKMVEALEPLKPDNALALVALTNVDIFVGRKPSIRGLAIPDKGVAVVSLFRMKDGSDYRVKMRLLKETLHELGHLLGQEHCVGGEIWCVMGYSQNLSDLDAKYRTFCPFHKNEIKAFLKNKNVDLTKFELPSPPAPPVPPATERDSTDEIDTK